MAKRILSESRKERSDSRRERCVGIYLAGTVGGSCIIVKNKLFFFGDYEGSRFDHPLAAGDLTVLSAAERGGDFSALLANGVQIYDPCTAGTGVSGTPCVLSGSPVPFHGNMIPPNRLDNAFKVLMASSLYPQATPSAPNSAVVLNGSQNNDDQEDVKIDFNASEKDRLFARYSRAKEIDPLTTSYLLGGNSSSEAHIDNTAFDETPARSPVTAQRFSSWRELRLALWPKYDLCSVRRRARG